MKNKGLSVLISLFAVLILSVSFSFPVFATESSDSLLVNYGEWQSITFDDIDLTGFFFTGSENYSVGAYGYSDLVTPIVSSFSFDFSDYVTLENGKFYQIDAVILNSDLQFSHTNNFTYGGEFISNTSSDVSFNPPSSVFLYDGESIDCKFSITNTVTLRGRLESDGYYWIGIGRFFTHNIGDISIRYRVCELVLSGDDIDAYQSGYNAGYSAGEDAGYTSGYSSGFQAGADSIDQDAIYDQGFQAGVDSVDTQSYYDAGYQAGYAAAYDAGYSSGYNVGYDDAMAAIESWGADGNIYPSLIFDWTRNSEFTVTCNARSQYPGTAFGSINLYNGFDLADPNHVYKVEFNFIDQGIDYDNYACSGFKRVFIIGDKEFAFTYNDGSFFIDGSDFSSNFLIGVYAYYARASTTADTPYGGCQFGFDDFNVKIYDYGFKDNMQNIIANQTNDLTTGYDAGSITESNTSLSSSLTQYDQAEAEITGQSVGFIDGVDFYDPASNAQLLTCITFCSSFLQSLFVNLGDWGILPMISLSLALGLMLVGWFKYRK